MFFNRRQSRRQKKPEGFIAIVALIIFAMMMIVAIDLQMTTMDTIRGIKDRNNYMQAKITADSIVEFLQLKMKNYEVGFSTGKIVCGFGKYAGESTMVGGNISGLCQDSGLIALTTPDSGKAQKDIKITMEVKGRAASGETPKTAKCSSFNGSCYVVPSPGTGDAGDTGLNCQRYKPNFTTTPNAKTTVESKLANGSNILDQLNYACNWNKLTFGSTLTDRVAVPLYYDEAGAEGVSSIVNVYKSDTPPAKKAQNLIVRLRTPCIPCGMKNDAGIARACGPQDDDTVCSNDWRYVLDDGGILNPDKNDIVVQWLINGECDDDGDGKYDFCGVLPIGDKGKGAAVSAFYESKINEVTTKDNENYILISKETKVYDTNTYPKIIVLLASLNAQFPIKLPTMTKPILTLFLSKPLLTVNKQNIPYLEYQILTDKPVSSSKTIIEASVAVDGNGFVRTLTKEVPKPLIDFAIQN